MSVCSVCTIKITHKSPGLQCRGMCKKYYHGKCIGMQTKEVNFIISEGAKWKCVQCRGLRCSKKPTFASLYRRLRNLKYLLYRFRARNQQLLKSIKFAHSKVSHFESVLKDMRANWRLLHALTLQNINLKEEVRANRDRIHELEDRMEMEFFNAED